MTLELLQPVYTHEHEYIKSKLGQQSKPNNSISRFYYRLQFCISSSIRCPLHVAFRAHVLIILSKENRLCNSSFCHRLSTLWTFGTGWSKVVLTLGHKHNSKKQSLFLYSDAKFGTWFIILRSQTYSVNKFIHDDYCNTSALKWLWLRFSCARHVLSSGLMCIDNHIIMKKYGHPLFVIVLYWMNIKQCEFLNQSVILLLINY